MANEETRGMSDFATGSSETGSGVKGKARAAASQVKERATEQLETKITSQKSRAADTLNGVAQSLLSSSQQLRDQQQDGASRAIERAAEGVERFATYLQETNVDEVVDQVHEFARRQPAAFIGGAFALGFVASRFLKASSPEGRRQLYAGSEGDRTLTSDDRSGSYDTTRGYARDGAGFGNSGDTSGSLGYGAGLSTTGGGTTGGGYTTSPGREPETGSSDLGDGSPGLTGGSNAGSR